MSIDRTAYNALVNDDGSNTVGTPIQKTTWKDVVLDPVDAALLIPEPVRVTGTTSSATPTPNADTTDLYSLTAQAAAAAFATPTGTPTNGQPLLVRIKDNGTARALTWSSAYVEGGIALPSTTVISKILTITFRYNTDNALNKWQCLAVAQEGAAAVSTVGMIKALHRDATHTANSGTGETTLFTYTLPAGTLAVTGDSVRIRAWGPAAANGNTKTLRVKFGGTTTLTEAFSNAAYTGWELICEVTRTGAATQDAIGISNMNTYGGLSVDLSNPAETLSGTVVILITGQSGTGSSDVTGWNFAVDFVPAA